MILHADYETFSEADLKQVGAYRYAEDPTTEILMLAVASETEGPFLWVNPKWRGVAPSDPRADDLLFAAQEDEETLVYAHNAQFERAVGLYVDGPLQFMRDRQRNWRCTAALCRKAAIPDSLDKATAYLGLTDKKDARGKALIRKFSGIQTSGKRKGERILPSDEPKAFKEFCEYCLQDVRAERELHAKLKPFELKGSTLDTFLLDIHLNDRGIPVNIPALRNARKIITELTATRHAEFQRLTGLLPTQREAVQGWLAAQGCDMENMQGETLDAKIAALEVAERYDDPLPSRRRALAALRLYSELNYSAVKKVDSMLACANADGRVRGTLLYHGAGTGRWAGRGIQPQNFKKPTIKNTDLAYKMLCEGASADDLDLLFGNPLEVISSCIRHFIDAGSPILDADYAGIEARLVNWLAGQEDALQMFRDGTDAYKVMAGVIYNCKPEMIRDGSQERQLGKTAELGCGYQMGVKKFYDTCHNWGLDFVTQELAERGVKGYRALHDKVVKLWYDCDEAARRAVLQPGTAFNVGDKLQFRCASVAGRLYLFMRLPSGRSIAYAEPRLEVDPRFPDRMGVTYYGQAVGSVVWGRVKMYGGKWVENAVQGIAADLMAHGAGNAVSRGYDVFTLIHDQALAALLQNLGQSAKEFAALLTDLPWWAAGLPLAADAKITPYYRK